VVQCGAVWGSVVQCGAVWCRVVQCVAVCCSVVQCVAVCCSVLQCVAVWLLRCDEYVYKGTCDVYSLSMMSIRHCMVSIITQ